MTRYRAAWLLPITDAPVRDGWIAIEDGRIAAMGGGSVNAIDLGRVAMLPALVNAHTHLELSYLHGRIPSSDRFTDWVRTLMRQRRECPDPCAPEILDAARQSIGELRASGTGLVGDVSNTLATVSLLEAARCPAHVFYELLGFSVSDPDSKVAQARQRITETSCEPGLRISIAAHAPYSVSAALFGAIRADVDAHHTRSTVHLGESAEEVEFLRTGGGPWRDVLEEVGVWSDAWTPPGRSPVEYLVDLGFLDGLVLAVHGVQLDGADLTRLRTLGVTIVSCPRSNQYVGVGAPPLEAFYAMGVDVAFGTDSLASVADLNMFAELAEARRLAPRVAARALLKSATLTGARALDREGEFGSLDVGKRAAIIAVAVPDGIEDVEEYLVSGVRPQDVQWVES